MPKGKSADGIHSRLLDYRIICIFNSSHPLLLLHLNSTVFLTAFLWHVKMQIPVGIGNIKLLLVIYTLWCIDMLGNTVGEKETEVGNLST